MQLLPKWYSIFSKCLTIASERKAYHTLFGGACKITK